MGAAAYHRGSALIRSQLDNTRPVEFDLMDRYNALPKYPDAGTPWRDDCYIREDKGVWWILCPQTGFGYYYRTMEELMRRWNVLIVGYNAITKEWQTTPKKGNDHGAVRLL
jgi:hypothetical protein